MCFLMMPFQTNLMGKLYGLVAKSYFLSKGIGHQKIKILSLFISQHSSQYLLTVCVQHKKETCKCLKPHEGEKMRR